MKRVLFVVGSFLFVTYYAEGFESRAAENPNIAKATSIMSAAEIATNNGPERLELIKKCDENPQMASSVECIIAKRF